MALTKAKKAVQIDHLAHELEGSTSAIVGTFAKLTVSQDYELRKVVRSAGGRYRVLKNKLAARASKGTKVEQALQGLKGVSSVAYTSGDPVVLAKALSTWMQENAEFTFKLGIVDGHVITVEEVKQLATMPSKEAIFPSCCSSSMLRPSVWHRHQRYRPRYRGGDQPGSRARQVCRRCGSRQAKPRQPQNQRRPRRRNLRQQQPALRLETQRRLRRQAAAARNSGPAAELRWLRPWRLRQKRPGPSKRQRRTEPPVESSC